jgi:TolA-binding protein
MARKIIIASSGLGCLVCIGLIIFALAATAVTIDPAQLESAKQNITSLIDSGKYAEAEEATDKLVGQFSESPDAAAAVHQIAQKFEQAAQYQSAIKFSQIVVDSWPNSEHAVWSQMGVVMSNIALGNDSAAKSAIDTLISNCGNNKDLPWALCIIGDDYGWRRQYDNAADTYKPIIERYPDSSYAIKARLGVSRVNILSLIESGSYSLAQQGVDLLINDYNDNPDLPETLYAIADRFAWSRQYNDADRLYRMVEELKSGKSGVQGPVPNFEIQKTNILSLIDLGQDADSIAAIDRLTIDFNNSPQLVEALRWVAKHYEWLIRYDQARDVYRKIVQVCPNSPSAVQAQVDYQRLTHRMNVFHNINFGNGAKARGAIKTMIKELSGNPDLPDEILWAAREYEDSRNWNLARAEYSELIMLAPDSNAAKLARLDLAKMSIVENLGRDDKETIQSKMDELIVAFKDNPGMPDALHWIAVKRESGMQVAEANELYVRIAELYPESDAARKTDLDIGRMSILELIEKGQFAAVQKAVDDHISRFAGSSYLATSVVMTGQHFCNKAWEFDTAGNKEQSKVLWEQALEIFNKMLTKISTYTPERPDAYFLSAVCCQYLEQYEQAINFFQKVVNEYPDYRMAGRAQVETANCCRGIWYRDTQCNPEPNDTLRIRQAYQKLLDLYPDCRWTRGAREQLSTIKIISGVKE